MGPRPSSSSLADDPAADAPELLQWPFGKLDGLDRDELREMAYEVFFTSCRSAPGFGGRSPLSYIAAEGEGGGGGGGGGLGFPGVTSRVKRVLGLRRRKAGPPLMRAGKLKHRPMTPAEIMRHQMGVTEVSDSRLRKTLMRAIVTQMGRRAETIILPLELLFQLKPSEFADLREYHLWQWRQLKILEAGLILHPLLPLDRLEAAALCFREIMKSSELKPIDTSKNSVTMHTLCNCVIALAWRNPNGSPQVFHWADGFPLNMYLYLSLLHAIFDLRDETVVLDEVDNLLELMKRTWTTLGINKMIHNVCFSWIFFEQYVVTEQVEPDLICATLTMLFEVGSDAKKAGRESGYVRVLSAALASMQAWAEKKLLDYHGVFQKGTTGMMENVLSLALSTAKILGEYVSTSGGAAVLSEHDHGTLSNSLSRNHVDQYIRSSIRNAFSKIYENGSMHADSMILEVDFHPSEILCLAKKTEDLAIAEKEIYSSILKKWHPAPTAVAVVTLHKCFSVMLKQYSAKISGPTTESVCVLQAVGKLEKVLVQMAVEDSVDCEDGGKGIIKEMIPYDVESIILNLIKSWMNERLRIGRVCVDRAKETENWDPKSKTKPYARSAVNLMKLATVTVDELFQIQMEVREELVQDLTVGIDSLIRDYASFVESCGTKQRYIPTLPPLTRCNLDSKLLQIWKKAAPLCQAGIDITGEGARKPKVIFRRFIKAKEETHRSRPCTSRGTQRLYVRLNTLHYLLALLHSIDKSLSFFSRTNSSPSPSPGHLSPYNPAPRRPVVQTHFNQGRTALQAATLRIAELGAYRLIFLDSAHTFYDYLYVGTVSTARIGPTLCTLKQNLTLLLRVLTDRAQPLAVCEVMKASFEAFLMVLLAGGSLRAFARGDHAAVAEDFASLKQVFCSCGEGLVTEEVVESGAATAAVEGVVGLMAMPTEKLVEDFTVMACEASGIGGRKIPMPPTTGRWSPADPNTVLRVLCHRDDEVANRFLKKTYELPKRR
ncbi:protein unc-13 homolog isoform X1 [Typha latifolia]|uniref:protein unc-13 homolog isoform X1 n=1 Tax=Typha latifolia TaxID=4733 RepID=UPI003C2CED66